MEIHVRVECPKCHGSTQDPDGATDAFDVVPLCGVCQGAGTIEIWQDASQVAEHLYTLHLNAPPA